MVRKRKDDFFINRNSAIYAMQKKFEFLHLFSVFIDESGLKSLFAAKIKAERIFEPELTRG